MKIKDVIKQLESLIDDRKSFFEVNGDDQIFRDDAKALEKAIEIIKKQVEKDEIEMLGKVWINMEYHQQEINRLKAQTNNTECKHDNGKPRLDLVPPGIIEAVGHIRTYGTEKYGENTNWEKVEPERYRAAMMRHLVEYLRDFESVDKESGLPHLWHMACNIAFLIELEGE